MKKSLFVCYSREDYEFVASFELEFVKAKNSSQIFVNTDLDIELKIDKAPGVINLGDRYQEKIEKTIPYYNLRHLVKPGLTGWAQINLFYVDSIERTKLKLEYDLFYLSRLNFSLDLKIIFKTFQNVFFAKGR